MFRAVKFLSFFLIVSQMNTALASSCTPYPSDLKSLEECCEIPVLFDDNLVGNCEFMCSKDKKGGDSPDCVSKCLFKNNALMRKKEINKTAVAHTYDKFGLANPGWKNITQEALDSCPLEHSESKSFHEAFEAFEKCMSKYFQEHCIEGKEPIECDKVEDFMEKCQNVIADCSTWPRWIVKLPEYCCGGRPELFSSEVREKTDKYCDALGIPSNLGTMECKATQMINSTGILAGGKWNFTIARDFLTEHSHSDTKWKSAIEKTIETCEKQVHADEKASNTDTYVQFWFYECVKGSLADFCPEYSTSTKKCRSLTKYKNACPDSVPPRKLLMVNGKM